MTTRTYPPILTDVTAALQDWLGLSKLSNDTIMRAMDTAMGEIETANSWAATPLGLSPRLNRALWALCIDLIIWRLRWRIERDPDTNDVSKALQTQRTELMTRLNSLNMETPDETARYQVAVFDLIDAPDLPSDNRMF